MSRQPPYDGSVACPFCPIEARNLYAVVHNFVGGARDVTLDTVRQALDDCRPLLDAHFAKSAHSHGVLPEPLGHLEEDQLRYQLDASRAANAEMRRALEWYANGQNYEGTGGYGNVGRDRGDRARAALRAAENAPEAREPAQPSTPLVSADAAGLHLSPLARDGLNLPPADPEEPTPPAHPFAANCPCGPCRATQDTAIEVVAREAVRQLSAPPAAEGLTAEEWTTLTELLESAHPVSAPLDEFAAIIAKRTVFAELAVRVRAAAEGARTTGGAP